MAIQILSMYNLSPMLVNWSEDGENKQSVVYVDFVNEKVISDDNEHEKIASLIIDIISEKKKKLPLVPPIDKIRDVFNVGEKVDAREYKR